MKKHTELNKYDYIVIGAGLSGCVVARELAERYNYKVLVVERRNHIAGNIYDEVIDGIRVQTYGPHFFTTSKWEAFEYLMRFGDFYEYPVKALSFVDGKYIARPYNLKSLKQLVGLEESHKIIEAIRKEFGEKRRVTIYELLNSDNKLVSKYGKLLYDTVFAPYIAKQWGLSIEDLDENVVNRTDIVIGYDEQLDELDYQYLPKDGFSSIVSKMIDYSGITIRLNEDGIKKIEFCDEGSVRYDGMKCKGIIFTGEIDELFGYQFGRLNYRSRKFVLNRYDTENELPCGVVSYPQNEEYIRRTEFKHYNEVDVDIRHTIVQDEYSVPYDKESEEGNEPYYPVLNRETRSIHSKYKGLASKYKNLYFIGRLAEFKYMDMDLAICNALKLGKKIGRKK